MNFYVVLTFVVLIIRINKEKYKANKGYYDKAKQWGYCDTSRNFQFVLTKNYRKLTLLCIIMSLWQTINKVLKITDKK